MTRKLGFLLTFAPTAIIVTCGEMWGGLQSAQPFLNEYSAYFAKLTEGIKEGEWRIPGRVGPLDRISFLFERSYTGSDEVYLRKSS
jgi:hypothetical protein